MANNTNITGTSGLVPGYFKDNENLLKFDFLNLQELVAKRAANQLWGNGFNLASENEAIQKKIDILVSNNDFFSLGYSAEKTLSAYGVVILTIDISKTGIPIVSIAQPFGQSRVSRLNWDVTSADTWVRMNQNDNSPYLHTTYLPNKITRQFVDSNNTVITAGNTADLFKKYHLKETETTNYGFIPVEFFQNLPKKNFFGDSNIGSYYPDNTAVKNLQNFIQELWAWLIHEMRFNRTRFFGQMSQQELFKLADRTRPLDPWTSINNADLVRQLVSDAWIQTNLGIAGATAGRTLEILVAQPQFNEAIKTLDWAISTYFIGCGYSKENEGSVQQTAFESTVKQSDDIETTRMKRTLRQRQFNRLIKKVLIAMCDEKTEKELIKAILAGNFSFEIKENNIIDRDKEIAQQQQLLALGLTTKKRAIQKLFGVNEKEAEEMLKDIENEMANDKTIQDLANMNLEKDNDENTAAND